MSESHEILGVSKNTIEAFHLMWDYFPHGVMLLKKNRDIVAVNKRTRERGIKEGTKCYQIGGQTEIHKYCLANKALETRITQRLVNHDKTKGRITDTYWVPLATEDGLYLHFMVNIDLETENKKEV